MQFEKKAYIHHHDNHHQKQIVPKGQSKQIVTREGVGRPADEADDALVLEGRVGFAGVSALVSKLQHLVHVGQLPAGLAPAHRSSDGLDAHT